MSPASTAHFSDLFHNQTSWSAWFAPSVEHVTLDLRIVSLSPMFGVEIKKNKNKTKIY